MSSNLKILVIDIGGTNVKVLATGQKERRRFPSGPKLTPRRMVAGVRKLIQLPKCCRAGDNANAFLGGFRLWKDRVAPP